MTKLSININKIATLRNSRGDDNPNLLKVALDIERFGADGITVHPRPDERHIKYKDVYDLKKQLKTEFNIEGNPLDTKFVELVLANSPTQVTLVPDSANQITSNQGWDTIQHFKFLQSITAKFKEANIRVSIFVNPDPKFIEPIKDIGADRIELYTFEYAHEYKNQGKLTGRVIDKYVKTAELASQLNIGINAGHDLNLQNLLFFKQSIPNLNEVSIGHAIICDSIYLGLENTIQLYKRLLI